MDKLQTTKKRIDYLDGLRGAAAVLVVIHHLMIGFYPSTYTVDPSTLHTTGAVEYISHNTPLGIGINGGFAVAIFLVLSGYVVGLATKPVTSFGKVYQSVIKRFFRFFLPILATDVIAYGLIMWGWHWNREAAAVSGSSWWLGQMWQMKPSLIEAIQQAGGSLFQAFPLDQVYNSSVWTMPYFFLGPVGLWLVVFLCRPRWLKNGVLMLLLVMLLKTHYWPIILGYFLGRVIKTEIRLNPGLQVSLLLITVLLGNYPQAYDTAQFAWLYSRLPILAMTHTSLFYQTIAAGSLLLLVGANQSAKKLLGSSQLVYLGQISFSIYLWHILVINSITSGIVWKLSQTLPYGVAVCGGILLSIPVIWWGSDRLYRWAERPATTIAARVLQWGVWLAQGYNKKQKRKSAV